jgi:dihydropteroate synthase
LIKNEFSPFTLQVGGRLIQAEKPMIMGILNLTPDSFYTISRTNEEAIIERARQMINEGADILDIGGQSTRPGAERITEEEEWSRVETGLKAIRKAFPEILISIDTFYSSVAENAVEMGANILNDVSAGGIDPKMFEVAGKLGVPYVLMHMQGDPQSMQKSPVYDDVVQDITLFFSKKINELRRAGVKDILLDPGFGFGKTLEHNYEILKRLEEFKLLACPLLIGMSRKKMIQNATGNDAENSLNGTVAANTIALLNGASILRVHDVQAAKDAISIVHLLK